MLFNSWEFLVLVLITLVCFYAVPNGRFKHAIQSAVLLLASTIFYGWQNWSLLGLLAFSCVGNAFVTLSMLNCRLQGRDRAATNWMRFAVVGNLSMLAIFKYAGFIARMIPGLPDEWVLAFSDIPLPIGISFYTFQGISMVIDMGRGKLNLTTPQQPDREKLKPFVFANFRDLSLYLLFFPQLIAGPIIKAPYFWPQLKDKFFRSIDWGRALRYLIAGYFMKMVVADNLATVTDVLTSQDYIRGADSIALVALIFGYSAQIFADFGGYSMIAIGLAALFGYRFPINFNFPYMSRSLTEFWRRWNMTLSAWLRDYLYVPLGGNRKGAVRTYINLFLVMFLGGLWHGSDWKFALWGTLHGLFLAVERFLSRRECFSKWRLPTCLSIAYTCVVAGALWTTFLMPDIETVFLYFERVFTSFTLTGSSIITDLRFFNVFLFGGMVVLYHFYGWYKEHAQKGRGVDLRQPWVFGALYAFMLFMILTNAGPQKGFVYFQF